MDNKAVALAVEFLLITGLIVLIPVMVNRKKRDIIKKDYHPPRRLIGCIIYGKYHVEFPESMRLVEPFTRFDLVNAICKTLDFPEAKQSEVPYIIDEKDNVIYSSVIGIGNYALPEEYESFSISPFVNVGDALIPDLIIRMIDNDDIEYVVHDEEPFDTTNVIKYVYEDLP